MCFQGCFANNNINTIHNNEKVKYMRQITIFSFIILVLLLPNCSNKKIDYDVISNFQDNSIPELTIDIADSTRVLVVMPHADDETVAGGLITFFKTKGASIHLLTLCEYNDLRLSELNCAAAKLGIEKVEIADFFNNTWESIMQDSITFWYDHRDSIKNVIARKVDSYNPHFLITYDSEIGGYGHPEHRISAELTEMIFDENKNKNGFAVKKIFQITLSEDLEKFLVAETPGYDLARRLTESEGLPGPDVSIDIKEYWPVKNDAAQCYQSQIKTLKRFHLVYDEKNKDEHIKAFSREYYRVVE
jgi:N-acetylglucosamine malate deacetylase 2